jgi:hypothetical protein
VHLRGSRRAQWPSSHIALQPFWTCVNNHGDEKHEIDPNIAKGRHPIRSKSNIARAHLESLINPPWRSAGPLTGCSAAMQASYRRFPTPSSARFATDQRMPAEVDLIAVSILQAPN